MKYLGKITDPKDLVTKEYADNAVKSTVSLEQTGSGSIVSFDRAFGGIPFKKIKIALTPAQDLHGYDHPWPAGGGTQLFDKDHPDGAGYFDSTGTIVSSNNFSYYYIPVTPGQSIYVSGATANSTVNYCWFTSSKGFISSAGSKRTNVALTVPSNAAYFGYTAHGLTTSSPDINTTMINLGTSALPYAPYSNECPIVGRTEANIVRTGANLYDQQWELGSISPTTGELIDSTTQVRCKNFIPVLPSTTYRAVFTLATTNVLAIHAYNANGVWLGMYDPTNNEWRTTGGGIGYISLHPVFITPANAAFIRFRMGGMSSYTSGSLSINYPDSYTVYEPFGTTYIVPFGQTVYGGDAEYIGGGKWQITPRMASVDLGTLTWAIQTTSVFTTTKASIGAITGTANPLMCSRYPYSTSSTTNKTVFQTSSSIRIYDNTYAAATAAEFKAAMSGVQLVYELATPGTPFIVDGPDPQTLVNNNNVWSNAGSIEVVYESGIDGSYIATYDGIYPKMTVGTSDVLSTSDESIEDNIPYLLRKSANGAKIGGTEYDKIIGASVAWNQLVQNGDFADGNNKWAKNNNSTWSVSSNVMTATFSNTTSAGRIYSDPAITTVIGHKYLISATLQAVSADTAFGIDISTNNQLSTNNINITTSPMNYARIVSATAGSSYVVIGYKATPSANFSVKISQVNCIDLTAMFGTAIADHALTMETATPGSGIAWLKSYGFFVKPYYPYNAGELISVKPSAHKMVGFNQWDEQTEIGTYSQTTGEPVAGSYQLRSANASPVPVIGGASYCFYCGAARVSQIYWYDASGKFISNIPNASENPFVTTAPTNAAYCRFQMPGAYGTTYNGDVAMSFSDPDKNGTYESYTANSYPLDTTTEWRGLFKMDADGNIYADGDTCKADGSVTRKYIKINADTFTSYNTGPSGGGLNYVEATGTGTALNGEAIATIPVDNSGAWSSTTPVLQISPSTAGMMRLYGTFSSLADFKIQYANFEAVVLRATPTSETAKPYNVSQTVFANGMEEYVDERTVPIPVGHETKYLIDSLGNKLNSLPWPASDGVYVVKQKNNQMSLFDLKDVASWFNINPSKSLSGSSAYITDGGEDAALKSLSTNVKPYQDLHGYDTPWSGGKYNIFNGNALTIPTPANWSAEFADNTITTMRLRTSNAGAPRVPLNLVVGQTYCFSWESMSGTTPRIDLDVAGTTVVTGMTNGETYTLGLNAAVNLVFQSNTAKDICTFKNVQVEKGSTPTPYKAYENKCPLSVRPEVRFIRSGKNLVDQTDVTTGSINQTSGFPTPNSSATSKYTGVYKVLAGREVSISASGNVRIFWYNENTYLSNSLVTVTNGIGQVTVPSNTTCFRLQANTAVFNNPLQMEYGPATTYEAYTATIYTVPFSTNLWDEKWELGSIAYASGADEASTTSIRTIGYIGVLPETTYFAKAPIMLRARYYDANHTYLGYVDYDNTQNPFNNTFKTPSNCYYMRFCLDATSYSGDISINYPGSDIFKHHHICGGIIEYITNGLWKIVPKMVSVDMGSLTWEYSGGYFRTQSLNSFIKRPSSNSEIPNVVSPIYQPASWNTGADEGLVWIVPEQLADERTVVIKDSRYTDATTFTTAVSGTEFAYETITPGEAIMVHGPDPVTVFGINNWKSDCGPITLEYGCDTTLFVNEKLRG